VFLVNSWQRDFRCGPLLSYLAITKRGQALSLTYGRFFAEFLRGKSLVPLGLLALSTCVGLRYGRAGILTSFPSAAPFGITLGSPNPWLIASATETLDFRGLNFSLGLWLLMPTFSLLNAPQALAGPASQQIRMLSYRLLFPKEEQTHNFGTMLSPGTFSAHHADRIVSCYTLFKGWLPLSQPPICLWHHTAFYT